jgi:SAM-dependent methyltransferase
MNLIE